MSRPVVARLAPFNRTSGPSTFDEAIVASAPVAILKSIAKIVTVSSSTASTLTIDWSTVSSVTTISLGYDTPYGPSAGVFGVSITNFDRTYYDPLETIAPVPGTASQFTVLKDGVYNFQLQAIASVSGTISDTDALSTYVNINGSLIRFLTRYSGPALATEAVYANGSFCRPLTAGTVVEFGVQMSPLSTTPNLSVGAANANTGVELYITRETTLVHVVPQ